jgi:hypothetical protein
MGGLIGAGLGMATGSMQASQQIQRNNKALMDSYKHTRDVVLFNQAQNERAAYHAAVGAVQEASWAYSEGKDITNIKAAQLQAKMGAGITAGSARAKAMQSFYTQAGRELGKVENKAHSTISNILQQKEKDNYTLQMRLNDAKAKLESGSITGSDASMMILMGGLQGAIGGAGSMGQVEQDLVTAGIM